MQFAEAGRKKVKLITACLLSRVADFFFFHMHQFMCFYFINLFTCNFFMLYQTLWQVRKTFIPLRPDQLKTAKIKNTSLKKRKKNLERVKMFRATFKFHKPIMFAVRDRPSGRRSGAVILFHEEKSRQASESDLSIRQQSGIGGVG